MDVKREFIKKAIESAIHDLPAIPAIAQSILEESRNPDSSVSRLEKLIKSDQAITGKLLRVVNSAYYGLPAQVSNVGQACLLLGCQQIQALALSMTLFSSIATNSKEQKHAMQKFWLHSLSSVSCVNEIGQKKKLPVADIAFLQVCTLMHDIGRLLLFSSFPELYKTSLEVAKRNQIGIAEVELELWGSSHAEIGRRMCEVWKFPAPIGEVIGKHEGPFEESISWEVYPIHIADTMTQFVYLDLAESYGLPVNPLALQWLNFSTTEYETLHSNCLQKISDFQVSDDLEAA